MAIVKNAVNAMESLMNEEQVRRAHSAAQKEIRVLRQLELKNRRELKKTVFPGDVQFFEKHAETCRPCSGSAV